MDDTSVTEDWMAASKEDPLISDPVDVLRLKEEYMGNANPNFLHGIDALNRHYEVMRRVRGDGNCFFRAFIFALCEQLLSSNSTGSPRKQAAATTLRTKIQEKIQKSKSELIAIGYSEVAIDTFWETFVDYLAAMETRSHAELYPFYACLQDFQTEGGESEYLVWYARLLTAGHLKKHAEKFQPFVEGLFPGQTVAQFCAAEVEPMGKECDQPQIAALTEALEIGVKIEYLDGSTKADENLQSYICSPDVTSPTAKIQEQEPISIFLLYRPGHYDILYPRPSSSGAN